MINKECFSVNTIFEIEKLIKLKKNKRKIIVIFVKSYLIKGFGISWLNTLIKIVKKKHSQHKIKFFIDAGNDYGLSLLILRENIDYLKLKSNKIILNKINDIAKKNKVLLNPNFNIVEFSKIKNYKKLDL